MMIPSLTDSLSLYGQYDCITSGKSLTESSHPAVMIPCSWSSTGSALVSFLISFRSSLLNLTKSTLISRSIVSVFSVLGRRLRVSARVISYPGMYSICIWYSCSLIIISCNLGGSLVSGFCSIMTSGLWSVSTLNWRSYRYMWNLWTPNTIARSSLSMHAYRFSVSVRDFDAYMIGFLFCISAAPSPFRLASVCNTGISVVFNYVNVESWLMTVLSFSKHSLRCSSHKKGASFFNNPRRAWVLSARLGINGDRYVIRPKNSCSSFLHVG